MSLAIVTEYNKKANQNQTYGEDVESFFNITSQHFELIRVFPRPEDLRQWVPATKPLTLHTNVFKFPTRLEVSGKMAKLLVFSALT